MNLIASTSTFSFFTLISRVLGYVRDILIAIFLGTSFFADAFFVAFRLPNTFRRLFAEGAFNAAFIPSYAGELAQDKEQADQFARNVFNLLFIILLFLVLIAEIFMPQLIYLIAPGFYKDPEKLKLAIDISRITFPFLFISNLITKYTNKKHTSQAFFCFFLILPIYGFLRLLNIFNLILFVNFLITFLKTFYS